VPHHPLTARQRLLDAAFDVWLDEPPAVLFSGFSVSRVAKAAGVTRATFYSYWPTSEDYLRDLLVHLATREDDLALQHANTTTAGTLAVARSGAVDIMAAACEQEFQRLIDDPALRLRLGFLSKMDDPEVAEQLRAAYRKDEARKSQSYGVLADGWGREPRPPFTNESLHALFQSVSDAMAARHVVDPEMFPAQLYPLVVLGLMMFMTRRADDSRTLPELVQHVNNWPGVGSLLQERRRAEEASRTAITLDPVTAWGVIRAARRMQGTMAWSELTLTEIGSVAGVSDESLLRTFGSKSGLAMAIIDVAVGERLDAQEPAAAPMSELRRITSVTADELRRDPGLAASALLIFTGGVALPARDMVDLSILRARLRTQIQAAQAEGQLRADLDADSLGATLVRVLVTDLAPNLTSTRSSIDLVDLVLTGAAAPASAPKAPGHSVPAA